MDLFNSLLHTITWGVAKLIDVIWNAFMFLAGIEGIKNDISNPSDNIIGNDLISNLLNVKLGDGRTSFNELYLEFMLMGFLILGVCLIVGVIKTMANKEDEIKSRNLVYKKSIFSTLAMVVAPFVFMVMVWGVSVIITTITRVMQASFGDFVSVTDIILGSSYSGALSKDVKFAEWVNYGEFKQVLEEAGGTINNYNYWLALLTACCTLVGFLMITFTVVERIIHIFFLYLVSPFVFAKAPLDQGKSYEQWRDLMLSKMFSLAGIIICIYLFFMLQTSIQNLTTNNIVRLLFLVGGVFTFTKIGTLVAHLISQGTGTFEGMSQGTSLGMLSTGLRMVEHTAMGLGRGALMGAGTTASQLKGAKAMSRGMGASGGKMTGGVASGGGGMSAVTGGANGEAIKPSGGSNGLGLGDASQNMAMAGAVGGENTMGGSTPPVGGTGAGGEMSQPTSLGGNAGGEAIQHPTPQGAFSSMSQANQQMAMRGNMGESTPYYMGATGVLGYMLGNLAVRGTGAIKKVANNIWNSKGLVSMREKIEANHQAKIDASPKKKERQEIKAGKQQERQEKKQGKIVARERVLNQHMEGKAFRKASYIAGGMSYRERVAKRSGEAQEGQTPSTPNSTTDKKDEGGNN